MLWRLDQCIYLGDEVRDVEATHEIGLRCIAVTRGYGSRSALQHQKPFALADTPTELPEIAK